MSEAYRNGLAIPSITKEAKIFNELPLTDVVQGMREASLIDKQIAKAELRQKEVKENSVKEEMFIPTGNDIRQALEEGEYR